MGLISLAFGALVLAGAPKSERAATSAPQKTNVGLIKTRLISTGTFYPESMDTGKALASEFLFAAGTITLIILSLACHRKAPGRLDWAPQDI